MKTYEIEVNFTKAFKTKAKNSKDANEELQNIIGGFEWQWDVSSDYELLDEDDPIECPDCDGDGIDKSFYLDADEAPECERCNGDGCIIPDEYYDDSEEYG